MNSHFEQIASGGPGAVTYTGKVGAILLTALCLCAGTAAPADADQGTAADQDLGSLSLEQLMEIKIDAASLHAQSLNDAPASVTIITQEDIRTFGYRTLAEALSGAPGFYTTYDHIYHFQGVRGFGLPGDYGTRLLLLVNGHNMTDNVLGQSVWFGQDFPLDMNLIKRIELIHGPASALYGSSGLFATINVVTFSPEESARIQVRTETGSLGEKKLQTASSFTIGRDAHVLVSASLLKDGGEHSIYVPEYDAPATNFGRAVDVDGEKGYHVFGNLTWHDWNFAALLGGREKTQVISWGQTVFNDPTTRSSDAPNFINATYSHEFSASRSIHWRTYYNSYRFRGIFRYPHEGGTSDNTQRFFGDWSGSQVNYRFRLPFVGSLTVGAVGQFDLRALMQSADITPVAKILLNIDRHDRSVGAFVQDEVNLNRQWKLNLGTRVDYSRYRAKFISPRAALIFQPSAQATYKLLYGRAFRNPTAFELFYTDLNAQTIGNSDARPEDSNTIEFVIERKVTQRWNGRLSVYHYGLDDLLVAGYTADNLLQYRNNATIRASGLEIEANGRPARWLQLVGSVSVQRSENVTADSPLPNSPPQLGKLRMAVPLFSKRLSIASINLYVGPRRTLAGAQLPAVFTSDVVINANGVGSNLEFQLGVRNLGNANYLNPLALNSKVDTLPSPRRSLFVSLTWTPRRR